VREQASTDSSQIQVRVPDDLRRAIEERRRREPDIPTRPEMIRRLLKQAVAAHAIVDNDRSAA
jgi:Ribbon-helix-helix protein, copG family